ncbi:Flp pilus assembly complex ATPase component TadA [Planctomycetota bacterium]|nr:Flp pilus assembly complex ATPase component TadA [Planctomycetota bacterium]
MPHLEVALPQGIKRISLPTTFGQIVTIGRSVDNAIALGHDNLASRHHASITLTPGGYVLSDHNSSNGTLIQGFEIIKVDLNHGMYFQVGNTQFRFLEAIPSQVEAFPDPMSAADRLAHNQEAQQAASTVNAAEVPSSAEARSAGGIKLNLSNAPAYTDDELATDPYTEEIDDDDEPDATPTYAIGSVDALASIGRHVPFSAANIALVNARAQIVHDADEGDQATAEVLHILRMLIYGCIRSGASDIHIEPKREDSLIRLRIDGAMVEVCGITMDVMRRIFSLIKVLGDIDISKKAIVQEGHFSTKVPGRRIDYRVSFTPSMHGQKLVLRVLDPVNSPQRLRDLQLPGWMFNGIKDVSRQNTGMVLMCGPTGSGKTTTLYAILRQINAQVRNVITIEDPIEYELPGITQIRVDDDREQTFNNLLRSCLRQDPDVIVVGEIRDAETATTAMQAATTGHLVLSTTHSKDTVGTVFRLLDLGVEPYLVASTLNLVLAQRLVRSLCPHCKEPRKATSNQILKIGRTVEGVPPLHVPIGCPQCFGTGYSGRRGVYELLQATDELRDVILNNPNMTSIHKALEMTMFQSLRNAGIDLIMKGETSWEEVARVVGFD